jgi:hypothetical protein
MNQEEFIILIKSIGFEKFGDHLYNYKEFSIYLYFHVDEYDFRNGYEWTDDISLNDLTPLENNFKKELRSIKLKQLLR